MILFVNVFITKSYATAYDRGKLPGQDRLDVFKYSLASLAVIPWTQIFIYVKLDSCYQDRREELENYIHTIFPADKVRYYKTRLDKQSKWRDAMEEVFAVRGDDLVWFTCNDDHIFMDYDLDVLNAIERRLKQMLIQHEHVACYVSHFPEMLCHANYGRQYPVLSKEFEFFEVEWINIDSIQILSKKVLWHWWFRHGYGDDVYLIRSDGNLPGMGENFIHITLDLPLRTLIPLRELCRHFDGYCRDYIPGGSADINKCTPLVIPAGFFQNNIKISFCNETRLAEHVHVNPLLPNYSTVDENGTDYKWMVEDIPLFWRPRIGELAIGSEPDRQALLDARNKSIMDVANSEKAFLSVSQPVPMDWLEVAYRRS